MLWMNGMGNDIATAKLSKDVDEAEQMIKEHNELKVWLADSYLLCSIYMHTYVICVHCVIHYVYIAICTLQYLKRALYLFVETIMVYVNA